MIFNRLRVGSPSAAAASLESPPTKTQRERERGIEIVPVAPDISKSPPP